MSLIIAIYLVVKIAKIMRKICKNYKVRSGITLEYNLSNFRPINSSNSIKMDYKKK